MGNILVSNKKANFNFQIIEEYEAGLILTGSEVKSIKSKEASLSEAFIKIENDKARIYGMHVNPWKFSINNENMDPIRIRELLLKKAEIIKLHDVQKLKGATIVPINLHLRRGKIKIQIGIAKGLKKYDKRQKIKERELKTNITEKDKINW